ncbi:MAG: cytochrome c oxidase subunit II, partial [Balneolaceae bacterium]
RIFTDGSSAVADEAYLRESILDPGSHVVEGYEEGMPSFQGILTDAQIESIILYIRSLEE